MGLYYMLLIGSRYVRLYIMGLWGSVWGSPMSKYGPKAMSTFGLLPNMDIGLMPSFGMMCKHPNLGIQYDRLVLRSELHAFAVLLAPQARKKIV